MSCLATVRLDPFNDNNGCSILFVIIFLQLAFFVVDLVAFGGLYIGDMP